MKTKRWTRALAATGGIAALVLAAGCSSAPESSEDGVTTINWWFWNPDASVQDVYIDAFEAANPDIKVEARQLQFGDYVNAVRLAVTTSDGPDVFGIQAGALTEQFAPLSADLTPYVAESLGAGWQDQLSADEQLAVGDKQVGLPWNVTANGTLWYNESLLQSLGLAVPTTLAELKAGCEVAAASGIGCVSHGALDAWVNVDVYQTIVNQLAPGAFYDVQAGEGSFADAPFVQAFAVWKSLFDDGVFPNGSLAMTEYPEADDLFVKGQALYFAGGGTWESARTTSAGLQNLAEKHGDDGIRDTVFNVVPFPAVDGAVESGRLFGGPDVGWAISEASSKKDAAWRFVEFMSATSEGQELIATRLQQPALTSVSLDYSDVVSDSQRAGLDVIGSELADLIGARQVADPDVEAALGVALSGVAAGTTSPEDAARSVQQAIDAAQ